MCCRIGGRSCACSLVFPANILDEEKYSRNVSSYQTLWQRLFVNLKFFHRRIMRFFRHYLDDWRLKCICGLVRKYLDFLRMVIMEGSCSFFHFLRFICRNLLKDGRGGYRARGGGAGQGKDEQHAEGRTDRHGRGRALDLEHQSSRVPQQRHQEQLLDQNRLPDD